jgi:hypothetical protein
MSNYSLALVILLAWFGLAGWLSWGSAARLRPL